MPRLSKPQNPDGVDLPSESYLQHLEHQFPSYTYRPLPDPSSKEIRLVELLPSNDRNEIPSIRLERTTCLVDAKVEPYEAISYVWGLTKPLYPVRCDDAVCWITKNLYMALIRFRRTDRPRVLWADAICINQRDLKEKSWQVRQMGSVYAKAERALIYLGEMGDDFELQRPDMNLPKSLQKSINRSVVRDARRLDAATDKLLKHKERMTDAGVTPKSVLSLSLDTSWSSTIWTLEHREWFTRVWVIQELCLASDALVVCGEWEMSYQELDSMITFAHNLPVSDGFNYYPSSTYDPFQRMARSRRAWLANPKGKSLVELLLEHRLACATDPRDHIYALVSLACDGEGIDIDYSKSVAEVLQDCARYCFRRPLPHHPLSIASTGNRHNLDLPSWVPAWDSTPESLPLYDDALAKATGDSQQPEDITFFDERTMEVSGFEIDEVDATACSSCPFFYKPMSSGALFYQSTLAWAEWAEFCNYESDEIYALTGEPLNHVFWQLLCAQKSREPFDVNQRGVPELKTDIKAMRRTQKLLPYDQGTATSKLNLNYISLIAQMVPVALYRYLFREWGSDRFTPLIYRSLGRRMFKTKQGYFGLGPSTTQPGDKIYLVKGAGVPFVLRSTDKTKGQVLVGECYVHGHMEGGTWDPDRCYNIYIT